MAQEPLNLLQWYHRPASEGTQAVHHQLCTLIGQTRCHIDRVQLHTKKRDSLHRGELALFPVDPKPQPAEVPVITQLIVEDPDAYFP